MSVFTHVSREALEAWLPPCAVGDLEDFAGIAAGVQNSNFFVTTTRGSWVLTLFETLPEDSLGFYLELMALLADQGLPCPRPVPSRAGESWRPLAGRPAALFSRLSGSEVEVPGPAHCAAVGAMLARMHLAAGSLAAKCDNPRGTAWRNQTATTVMPFLAASQRDLLADEMACQESMPALPRGIVHGDLFRDNVLFSDEAISGVLDFYFAGNDDLLFDLAVAANDWCVGRDGDLDAARVQALLGAYQALRPLQEAEAAAWPLMLRRAALRFWLSRLEDFHLPRPGRQVLVKDPGHFQALLQVRRNTANPPWLG